MRYTLVFTRGDETDFVVKQDEGRILAAPWCMGYIRGALSRGWTLVSIDSVEV